MELDKDQIQEQIQEKGQVAIETVSKPFKEWERMRNPWAGWVRVGLGLISPFVLWSNSILLLLLFVGAVFTHPYWFPPYKDTPPHPDVMTRLIDRFQIWTKTTTREERFLFYIPGFAIGFPYICFMWGQSLFWGLFFLGAGTMYKVLFAQWLLANPDLEPKKAKATKAAKKPATKKSAAKKSTAKKKTEEEKAA